MNGRGLGLRADGKIKKAARIKPKRNSAAGGAAYRMYAIAALGDVPPPEKSLLNLEWICDWCVFAGLAEFEAVDDFENAACGRGVCEFRADDFGVADAAICLNDE